MAQPVRIKGGKVRVLLSTADSPNDYTAPCGFTSRSITFNKGLNEYALPDCDDPDAVNWQGRDATSLSISVSGEGVLASASVETWFDAWDDVESTGVKIEMEFPSKTITWTGFMHVENITSDAPNGQTVTMNVSLQSDGEMVRVVS